MRKTALIIEDEKNILELIKYNLEQDGYKVLSAMRGDDGLSAAIKHRPDIIILDLMLPVMDGLEVCKAIRSNKDISDTRIIMVTAKSEEADKVIGLELGADDYLTKPFSPRELVARVKAILRRGSQESDKKILSIGQIKMDIDRHEVSIKGKKVELTSKEFYLLKSLIAAHGRVLKRQFLLDQVWGYDQSHEIETRTIDMHIGSLRKKLKSESSRIVTVKNEGYRLDID